MGLASKKLDFPSHLTQKDNSEAALAIEERDPLFETELPFWPRVPDTMPRRSVSVSRLSLCQFLTTHSCACPVNCNWLSGRESERMNEAVAPT